MSGRNPADLWRDLAYEAGEDDVEHAAGVSVAQAEQDLAAAGFDTAAERARASAKLARLDPGAAREAAARAGRANALENDAAEPAAWVTRAEPAPQRPRSVRWTMLLAATLAAAATGGVFYALGHRSKPVEAPRDAPSSAPLPAPSVTAEPSEAPIAPSPERESKPPAPRRRNTP